MENCEKNKTVIVFTDELNSEYLNDIEDILKNIGHSFLNGEALVIDIILRMVGDGKLQDSRYLNNYFTFQASNIIKFYAKYKLVQRKRGQCHNCDAAC